MGARFDDNPPNGSGTMTVLTHAIPDDLLTGLRTGDEKALEHGFNELFPALLAQADSELHDLPSASRIVERAFLRILSGPPIEDAATFGRLLEEEMHGAIIREQSRLAALRRFEHNEHVGHHEAHHTDGVSAQASWTHIREMRERSAQPRAAHDGKEAQHLAAEHLSAAMSDRRRWSIPIIVFAIVALCAAAYGLTRIDPRPSDAFVTAQLNSSNARTISSAAGRIGNVSLTDETTIRIGAGSSVRVVNNFGDPLRAILVQGAVSLAVAPQKKPFEIRAKNLGVSVTDGKLDVRADPDRPAILRIIAGSPTIKVGDSSWVAAAGQSYAIDGAAIRPATTAELDEAFAWLEGRFVVNGTVRDVVGGFRRWYDVDVGIADNSIADLPAQVSGSLESLTSAMTSLEKSAKVRMIWQDRHMLLFRK